MGALSPWLSGKRPSRLKNRGVEDILGASVQGLEAFPDALAAVLPKTQVQLCCRAHDPWLKETPCL